MEIEILEQQCGGTEFVPRPHRLHLGAQNAEGVDRLQFILPAAWAGCTLALYLRRSDGVQLAAIPLDADVFLIRQAFGSVLNICIFEASIKSVAVEIGVCANIILK